VDLVPRRRPRHVTPHRRSMSASRRSALTLLLACVAFTVLVTANSGGYRYGVADQAFYIPAVLRHLDPALFPRDRALIDGQSRLLVLDEIAAWLVTHTGVSLPVVFLAGYVATTLIMAAASWLLARRFGLGRVTSLAFVLALTLRHQVLGTGVNTFEGHFHPRVLAFALGLGAVAAITGRRLAAALTLVGLAVLVHPTTGGWFAVWTSVAWVAMTRRGDRLRLRALPLVVLAGLVGVLSVWAGLLVNPLERMDPAWTAAFAWKDYLFIGDWSATTWLANALIVSLIPAGYAWRRRAGVSVAGEGAIVAGCLVLVAAFLASLPLAWARVALALQLQPSRVLWAAETLALLYAVWAVSEAGGPRLAGSAANGGGGGGGGGGGATRRAWALACVLALASIGRGYYGLEVEHPERTLVRVDLQEDLPWIGALRWARDHTAPAAHVLADPAHAWKYGVSVRVGAERDVFLEEVKDAAIALYARATATRVVGRTQALGVFETLDEDRARALAQEFDLDYLISERPLALPVAHAQQGFTVYRLR